MLTTLRRITQEVDAAPDLPTVLQTVVTAVKNTIHVDSCSVFLLDEQQQHYLLSATEGLNPNAVNQLKIPVGKGLVSVVGERAEIINIDNAPTHPQFYFDAYSREEPYHAFLGVPIVHRRHSLGVLVAQKHEERRFDEEEEAFLVTLSAQLAGAIAQAKASGHFSALLRAQQAGTSTENIILKGVACVNGIAVGMATVIYPQADLDAVPDQMTEDIPAELLSFEQALATCRVEITGLRQRLANTLPASELALFDAYLNMLEDNSLGDEIRAMIQQGCAAQTAIRDAINQHEQHFSLMDDIYLRERGADIRSLGQRLLACLQEQQRTARVYPEKTILVGEEITAADLAEVPDGRLVGIVSGSGSINAHVAILARALGIPTILGVEGLPIAEIDKTELFIDGSNGDVYVAASLQLQRELLQLQAQEQRYKEHLQHIRDLPTETLDGHKISLRVNVGLAINRGSSLRTNAEGVGLFRSEVVFMGRDRFPSEEEQRIIYRQLLSAFAPRPVVMRTLDVGSDKNLPYFEVEEENPALGWRGIRITLDHPEVFLVQIRAMLRASEGLDNLSLLLPMISTPSEVDESIRLIHRALNELREEGLNIALPQIGAMIEVPSAVYQAKDIIKRVNFLSVGSNDLIQYLLAVDRNNAHVAHLYQALHPAVLQALKIIVDAAKAAGKWVSICGEMVSDPLAVPLLVALGFDCLSTHSANLLQVKSIIRNMSLKQGQEILARALDMEEVSQVKALIESQGF